ncbi:FtsK/SpoIIIE domain-containing protein [Tessaracoccus caeni]|uniref:FtsK/SpoIIIE domain-containing protein n=1 Tax=Tessaracoccus caeni TaxID=3031239 RepID=UPI0023DCD15A|nr:FtsK/SpoIIIE domain-containing protein [Tessaracoccus caeni]MDF1487700.1 FtsK/SpoIIIE domain-containing protein [Tessaracoccus caeni]
MLSGPDRGVEVMLPYGISTVGRNASSTIRLSDPRVSKNHAQINIVDAIEIVDTNSANGVDVGGVRVARGALAPGDQFRVGDTVAVVELLRALGPANENTDIVFMRSPKVLKRPRDEEIEAPEVPKEPPPAQFPLLAMVAPLIMGAVLYMFTQSVMSLIFVALSPIMMLGSWASQWFGGRRQRKKDTASFKASLAHLDARVAKAGEEQRTRLEELFPSLDRSLGSLGSLDSALWTRRPENPEFGCVRLGIGDVLAATQIRVNKAQGRPDLLASLSEVVDARKVVHRAPVIANLAECGNVGVAGAARSAGLVARGLILQLAVTHSPNELILGCLTSTRLLNEWSWLQWLPHVNPSTSSLGSAPLSSDEANGRRVLERLEELIEQRSGTHKGGGARGPLVDSQKGERVAPPLPLVVVVVQDALAELNRLIRVAERGPDVGVHVIWVADAVSEVPAACRTYVDVDQATVGMVREELVIAPLEAEGAHVETAQQAARQLAPMVDAAALADDETDLPLSMSMVTLIGREQADDASQILAHWRENGSLVDRKRAPQPREQALTLRSLVGHTGLEPFTLDLRAQGPHALVGGTTGAGKSEFLQAWLLGMAMAYAPTTLTFLLVDYKGGTAFAHCVKLPHCVGLVTDLSPHLVRRVLRSLRAEITRREHLFNEKGVKDLIEFENRGDPDCPPALVIVVDEFAALKADVPEFVDGVIDIAQRGRSLGLHLILATQRPAGVIGDNIRANTNLRIALRMNDEHDSKDVIDDVVSAHFDPAIPGRGAARVGPGRIIRFQTAYPGARTPIKPDLPTVGIQEFAFGNRTRWSVPRPPQQGPKVAKDIERILTSLIAASQQGEVASPRRPWLDELSRGYDLLDLRQRRDDELVLGKVDDPDDQSQRDEYFRPDLEGNILFVGAGGSGKSTALRSLALASARTPRTGPVHVYGIDFTGSALVSLEVMPNVGSIIPGADEERVARLLRTLDGWVSERADRFAAVNASSLPEYRELAGRAREPRILVLVDGFSAFYEEYAADPAKNAQYQLFLRLLAEGRAVGVHFAVTADRPNVVSTTVSSAFLRRVILRQANENAYLDLSVPRDMLSPSSPPGRGIWSPENLEIQLACAGGKPNAAEQVGTMELLADAAKVHHRVRPPAIRKLPVFISLKDLPRRGPILGLSDLTLDAHPAPSEGLALIAGTGRSGRSNAIAVWAQTLKETYPGIDLVLLAARKSPISGLRIWRRTAVGQAEAQVLIETLLAQPLAGSEAQPTRAVFVEGLPDLSSGGLGMQLATLARRCSEEQNLFVAEGSVDTWNKDYDVKPLLLGAGQVLLLQVGSDSAFSFVDFPLPKLKATDRVPGRGFWAQRGRAVKVQIPMMG